MTMPIKRPPAPIQRGKKVILVKSVDKVLNYLAGSIGRVGDEFGEDGFAVRFLTGPLRGRQHLIPTKCLKRTK